MWLNGWGTIHVSGKCLVEHPSRRVDFPQIFCYRISVRALLVHAESSTYTKTRKWDTAMNFQLIHTRIFYNPHHILRIHPHSATSPYHHGYDQHITISSWLWSTFRSQTDQSLLYIFMTNQHLGLGDESSYYNHQCTRQSKYLYSVLN